MLNPTTERLHCDDCKTVICRLVPKPDGEYKYDYRVDYDGLQEYFHIKESIWNTVAKPQECLCIRCLETRLGWELESKDFTDTPCNDIHRYEASETMQDRVLRGNPNRTFTLNHHTVTASIPSCYYYWRSGDVLIAVHGMRPNF